MKRMFLSVSFVLLMVASIFPQGWGTVADLGTLGSINGFTVSPNVFTNKNGHNFIFCETSGKIIYKLFSSTGTLIRTIELQSSDGSEPKIIGNENEIFALYLYSSQLIVKKSTDGGATWSINSSPTSANINIFNVDIDASRLYLVWDTGSSVFFSSRNLSSSSWAAAYQIDYNSNGVPPLNSVGLTHNSNYIFLYYASRYAAYVHTYSFATNTWYENFETIDGLDVIEDVTAAVTSDKLLICMYNESIIGTRSAESSGRALRIFSRPINGGTWTLDIEYMPSRLKTTITSNGQLHLLWDNYYASYSSTLGWSSAQQIFGDIDPIACALSSYGNNVFAFLIKQDYQNPNHLYFRSYNAIPESPTNLNITIGTTSLLPELTWTASEKSFISQYEIWGKVGATGTWTYIFSNTTNNWTDHEMYDDPNVSYYYKVRAKSTANLYSPFSAEVSTIPAAPTGVVLSSSSGTYGNIKISWTKNSEANVTSYEVYREDVSEGSGWQLIGTTALNYLIDPQYTYVPNWGITTCNYKVRTKNNILKYSPYSGIASVNAEPNYKQNGDNPVDDEMTAPVEYNISQNYPNPFNPSTVIVYDIPEAARVTLKVYDLLGREVANLVDEYKEAGRYSVKFDASRLSTGIYIYKLAANEFQSVKKMNFVK